MADFSRALKALKGGRRVYRDGWNGKGMWLIVVPAGRYGVNLEDALNYDNGVPIVDAGEAHIPANMVSINTAPWIGMRTAEGKFVPWIASQADLLAEDWNEVEWEE